MHVRVINFRQTLSSGCHIQKGTYLTLSPTLTITLTLLTLTVTVRVTLTLLTAILSTTVNGTLNSMFAQFSSSYYYYRLKIREDKPEIHKNSISIFDRIEKVDFS